MLQSGISLLFMLMGDGWAPSDLSHTIASEVNLVLRVSVSFLSL